MYKRQGRSQCEMMTHAYGGFLVQVDITVFYSRQDAIFGITFVLVTLEELSHQKEGQHQCLPVDSTIVVRVQPKTY